jgi:hypothetical protein
MYDLQSACVREDSWVIVDSRPVFLNRRAAARYRALTSIIPGRENLF